jgi:VanZ family protein
VFRRPTSKTSDGPPWTPGERVASARLLPLAFAVILAATAVPVDVSLPGFNEPLWRAGLADVLVNVVLYVPLGVALRRRGWANALAIAAALSVTVECSQLFCPERFTAVTDVVANIGGALVGHALSRRLDPRFAWGLDPIGLTGGIAALCACFYAAGVVALSLPGRPSDFSNWDPECRVIVGDELTRDRRWEGQIYAAAVFNRSLGRSEIARLCSLAPDEKLRGAVDPLSPLLFAPLTGRLEAVRGVPLLDTAENERFFRAMVDRGELCVIVWFRSSSEEQTGPARIIGFSKSPWSQNFSLGQEGRDIVFRLRTPTTIAGGFFPQTRTRPVLHRGRSAVVAATYDGRNVRVYVDGRSEGRLNLNSRGRVVPYLVDTGLPTTAFLLGSFAGVVWVVMAWRAKRRNVALWGAFGGGVGGLIFILAGGADALPEFERWVPVLAAWGGAVVGGSLVVDTRLRGHLCFTGTGRDSLETFLRGQ